MRNATESRANKYKFAIGDRPCIFATRLTYDDSSVQKIIEKRLNRNGGETNMKIRRFNRDDIFPIGCIVASMSLLFGLPFALDLSHSPLALISLAVGACCLFMFGLLCLFNPWF